MSPVCTLTAIESPFLFFNPGPVARTIASVGVDEALLVEGRKMPLAVFCPQRELCMEAAGKALPRLVLLSGLEFCPREGLLPIQAVSATCDCLQQASRRTLIFLIESACKAASAPASAVRTQREAHHDRVLFAVAVQETSRIFQNAVCLR